MKRQSGYYATRRRPGIRAAMPPRMLDAPQPVRRRRYVMQSHAVGQRPVAQSRWVGIAAVFVACAIVGTVWARRR